MARNGWEEYDWRFQADQIVNEPLPEPEPIPARRPDELPKPFTLASVFESPPPLSETIIDGVLRQGHKLILSGPSKAGKSFALMRLCLAFAEGYNWFGSRCKQGRVLYVNMEIDNASCINRFLKIYEAEGLNHGSHPENIVIWGLRGHSQPLSQLSDKIIAEAKHDYMAIVIDPLYKVMDGDENSNSDISRMVGEFDRIATETGASIVFAHHFAKGASGDKAAIDRAAGAGTFARDPDAIVTMTQLDMPEDVNEKHTAWRIEFRLREFPDKEPYNVWFEYPLHKYDESLEDEQVETVQTIKNRLKERKEIKGKSKRIEAVRETVESIMVDGEFKASDFRDMYTYESLSLNAAKERLKEAGYRIKPGTKGRGTKWAKAESVNLSKQG